MLLPSKSTLEKIDEIFDTKLIWNEEELLASGKITPERFERNESDDFVVVYYNNTETYLPFKDTALALGKRGDENLIRQFYQVKGWTEGSGNLVGVGAGLVGNWPLYHKYGGIDSVYANIHDRIIPKWDIVKKLTEMIIAKAGAYPDTFGEVSYNAGVPVRDEMFNLFKMLDRNDGPEVLDPNYLLDVDNSIFNILETYYEFYIKNNIFEYYLPSRVAPTLMLLDFYLANRKKVITNNLLFPLVNISKDRIAISRWIINAGFLSFSEIWSILTNYEDEYDWWFEKVNLPVDNLIFIRLGESRLSLPITFRFEVNQKKYTAKSYLYNFNLHIGGFMDVLSKIHGVSKSSAVIKNGKSLLANDEIHGGDEISIISPNIAELASREEILESVRSIDREFAERDTVIFRHEGSLYKVELTNEVSLGHYLAIINRRSYMIDVEDIIGRCEDRR